MAINTKIHHCESCGQEWPNHDEGYTTCCNELICYGDNTRNFGVPGDSVQACCWAVAEEKFEAAGRDIPDGSRMWYNY